MADIFAEARTKTTFQDYLIVYNAQQVHEIINATTLETDLDSIKDKIISRNYIDDTLPIRVILLHIPSYIEDVENFVQTQLARYYLSDELSEAVYDQLSKEFFTMLKTIE